MTVVEPCPLVVAMPEFEMVAAAGFEELQDAEVVRSLLLLSLYLPVALNCWLTPRGMEGEPGVIWIDCKMAGAGPGADEPPPPQPTSTAATAAKHTSANSICNVFMRYFPLVPWDPKIGMGEKS